MARKKEEFDPLGGPIGGSGLRKKKSKGKSFDVLGGGFGGEHAVEKESFDTYSDASFGDTSDALMETGGSSSKSKPKKKGFFAYLFGGGGKKKKQPVKKNRPLESELESEEQPQSYVPKHVRDPGLTIHDGVMETGIVDHMIDSEFESDVHGQHEYEEPRRHAPAPAVNEEEEEDLFEEEEIVTRSVKKPASRRPSESASVKTVAPPPSPGTVHLSAASGHTCCLCGATSPAELPMFGSEHPVPLCRTCYRAVTTLMKFRDPADEREIKAEWCTLCPNLDSDRADAVIEEGRRYS